jgi:hypothetical protein
MAGKIDIRVGWVRNALAFISTVGLLRISPACYMPWNIPQGHRTRHDRDRRRLHALADGGVRDRADLQARYRRRWQT